MQTRLTACRGHVLLPLCHRHTSNSNRGGANAMHWCTGGAAVRARCSSQPAQSVRVPVVGADAVPALRQRRPRARHLCTRRPVLPQVSSRLCFCQRKGARCMHLWPQGWTQPVAALLACLMCFRVALHTAQSGCGVLCIICHHMHVPHSFAVHMQLFIGHVPPFCSSPDLVLPRV